MTVLLPRTPSTLRLSPGLQPPYCAPDPTSNPLWGWDHPYTGGGQHCVCWGRLAGQEMGRDWGEQQGSRGPIPRVASMSLVGVGVVQWPRPQWGTGWWGPQGRRARRLVSAAAGTEPRGAQLRDRWLAVQGAGWLPRPRPRCRTGLGTGTAGTRAGDLVFVQARRRPAGSADAQAAGSSRCPMRRPALPSRRPPPPMLLLLLSPWPVWAESSTAAATSGTPGTPYCPEACARAPGGLVNCSGRALPAVPSGLSRGVRALLLDHNRVRALPPGAFVGAGTLLRLDLRENGLRWVHARAFWSLGALQQLDLSDNLLEALAPGTFSPLRALRSLSLAGNRLARLEPAALGALPLLRALSLRDNQLSALAPGLLAGLPALHALHLRGNPWTCGCALRPLCSWLRRHPRPAPEAETLLCVLPGRQSLSPLTAFTDAAFSHCSQPLGPWDLAVVYVLGPVSFLASLAACLALGSALTACRTRRSRAGVLSRLRPSARDPGPPAASARA
ncbi:leucine-rich repeat-containing protein 26 [Mustela erminea]|uniref:leucine-rich repeat-containing protein 26 n=1 Tax=Mustela erminea TaxID=36723 RepID=UPI0013871B85|nr:leucine-rich repeat-containing protein 26 [Mustela erminea]